MAIYRECDSCHMKEPLNTSKTTSVTIESGGVVELKVDLCKSCYENVLAIVRKYIYGKP